MSVFSELLLILILIIILLKDMSNYNFFIKNTFLKTSTDINLNKYHFYSISNIVICLLLITTPFVFTNSPNLIKLEHSLILIAVILLIIFLCLKHREFKKINNYIINYNRVDKIIDEK